jgi:hypothetical protein
VRVIFKFYVFVASFICRFFKNLKKPEKIFISIFDDRDNFLDNCFLFSFQFQSSPKNVFVENFLYIYLTPLLGKLKLWV